MWPLIYRSEEASSEMEALAKASHNPDEIVLGEDDEDEEQEIEGIHERSRKRNVMNMDHVLL